ncbi:MAG: hypothetical protein Q9225_002997 [Loekoesia sp. 1 TL-2023]
MAYPSSAGGQPPSFKTNVNRAKTKRWVEAKSYSYDGDDWGDIDEYDEYGGYDEPLPPPRPTGLRQRGQSASREQQGFLQSQHGGYNNPEASQHGYGNIGRQGPVQQQYSARSATNPPYQTQPARSDSFDHGDERRAFSANFPPTGAPPQQSGMYQADPYPQGPSNVTYNHPSGASAPQTQQNQPGPPPASSVDYPRQPNMDSRTHSMTSNSSVEFHNRRDFSPSAVPPPLQTRGSPSPQNKPDTDSAWHPPRKSSLSQQNQPEFMYNYDVGTSAGSDTQKKEPTPRELTGSDSSKPLPFVRPADIYKRMHEEKEKERQSQDSSRPSMDAILDDSRMGDDLRKDSGDASNRGQDEEPRQRSRSTLDPVAERKSEYGMAGLQQNEADSRGGFAHHEPIANDPAKSLESQRIQGSLSPQLPDVARMSGFGELFAGTTQSTKDPSRLSAAKQSDSLQTSSHQPLQAQSDATLQHQPSLGFRSVVHQAFDAPHEQIPQTPSSSNADSSLGRSGSGGTSVVSPIISRGPSSATPNLNFRDPQIRPATPPTVDTKTDSEDRPQSSGSLGTPKAIHRKPSPGPANQQPANFIRGHRRDLSTPSPDNSPARTPAVEANEKLQQPQEAELAMTTPIRTHFSHDHGQPKHSQSNQPSPDKPPGATKFPGANTTRAGLTESESANSPQSLAGETPKSPAESTRSRVRNLADKFESGRSSPAGSERAASPIKTSFLPSQTMNQSRPLAADRLESFRPRVPGGWESSASLAPLVTPSKPEPSAAAKPLEQRLQDPVIQSGKPRAAAPGWNVRQEDPSSSQIRDEGPSDDPFASLAAAGNALAGAFSTTAGSDKDEDKHSSRGQQFPADHQSDSTAAKGDSNVTRSRNTSVNTAFIPEASKPAMLIVPNDEASSIQPTPLDKLSQPAHSDQSKATDYFTGITTPKQQASGDSYTTQDSNSAKRLGLLPRLSTDAALQYESDRLHREIIRELSPRLTSEPSTTGSDLQYQDHPRHSANSSLNPQHRESLVIPREYDSYWNDPGSGQSSRASSVKGPSKAVRDAISLHAQDQSAVSPATGASSKCPTSGGEAQLVQDGFSERPSMPPHRFSWEGPSEAIPPIQKLSYPKSPLSDNRARHGPFHDPQERTSIDSGPHVDQQALHAPTSGSYPGDASIPLDPIANDHRVNPQAQDPSFKNVTVAPSSELEPGPAPGHTAHDGLPVFVLGEPSSLISEGGPHPDGGPFGHQNVQERNENLSQPISNMHNLSPLPGPPAIQPKTQSFREILALKESKDRIEAYNEARAQLANVDTGLAHWLAITLAELPEHKEVFPNGRLPGTTSHKPSTTRTKLGGLLPGSSVGQQPYYQQYLSASSPGGTAVEASNVPGGHTPQAYSPASSGKLSSQQMQARGKDLLHSAGVFSGKANVAAKGLFSKGRSKFRGGNADKVDK